MGFLLTMNPETAICPINGASLGQAELPDGEWPETFSLKPDWANISKTPMRIRKEATRMLMELGAEASKRGYLFEIVNPGLFTTEYRFTRKPVDGQH